MSHQVVRLWFHDSEPASPMRVASRHHQSRILFEGHITATVDFRRPLSDRRFLSMRSHKRRAVRVERLHRKIDKWLSGGAPKEASR